MHLTPLQSWFEHLYYAALDIAFLVLIIIAANIVKGTRWKIHLDWIVPYIFMDALSLVYRAIISAHYFLAIPISRGVFSLALTCLYTGDAIGIYGSFILCRTLRQLVTGVAQEQLPEQAPPPADEEAWPPPPVTPTRSSRL